jgi:DNA-directed RNA polymerase specialized sigma24 family protein
MPHDNTAAGNTGLASTEERIAQLEARVAELERLATRVFRPARHWLKHEGQLLSLTQWSRKTGLSVSLIMSRLARGKTTAQALNPRRDPRGGGRKGPPRVFAGVSG